MSNVQTVQGIYAAFGKGDVPAILGTLAEDVEWEYGAVPNGVPWLEQRRGRAAVGGFFEAVGRELDISLFAPKTFLEGPNLVAVLVDVDAKAKRSGGKISERDEVHLWHFDASGKVVKFRHVVDTYAAVKAYAS